MTRRPKKPGRLTKKARAKLDKIAAATRDTFLAQKKRYPSKQLTPLQRRMMSGGAEGA